MKLFSLLTLIILIILLIVLIYTTCLFKEGITLEGSKTGVSHSDWKKIAGGSITRIAIKPTKPEQIWALGKGHAQNNLFATDTKVGVGNWNAANNGCCVVSISFDSNGGLFGVGTDGKIWQYLGKWKLHTKSGWVRFITIVGDWIYGIGSSYATYRIPLNSKYGTQWQQLTPGEVTNIAVDSTHTFIYGVGLDLAVYRARINPSGISEWIKLTSGSVKQIQLYEDNIFGIGTDNNIYVHDVSGKGNWIKFDDQPKDGVIWLEIRKNYMYAIKTDNTLAKRQIFNEAPNPILGSGKWSSPLPNKGSLLITADDDKFPDLNGGWTANNVVGPSSLFTIKQNGNKIVVEQDSRGGGNKGTGEIIGNKITFKWNNEVNKSIIGTFLKNKGTVNIIDWKLEGEPVNVSWVRNNLPDFNGVWNDGKLNIKITQSGGQFVTSFYPNFGIGTGNITPIKIVFSWSKIPGIILRGIWAPNDNPNKIIWDNGKGVWHKV